MPGQSETPKKGRADYASPFRSSAARVRRLATYSSLQTECLPATPYSRRSLVLSRQKKCESDDDEASDRIKRLVAESQSNTKYHPQPTFSPSPQLLRRSSKDDGPLSPSQGPLLPASPLSAASPSPSMILGDQPKDFFESELLLYRNIGHVSPKSPIREERVLEGYIDRPASTLRRRGSSPKREAKTPSSSVRINSKVLLTPRVASEVVAESPAVSPHHLLASKLSGVPAPIDARLQRASWLTTLTGVPRPLSSAAQRSIASRHTDRGMFAVVDIWQELQRYQNSEQSAAKGDSGECGCDQATIERLAAKYTDEDSSALESLDAKKNLSRCEWCRRRPAAFLCLDCASGVCPSHVQAHFNDSPKGRCHLFLNILDIMTSFDRIFWCEPCKRFTWLHTDAYNGVADKLVETRGTYLLESPATDVLLRHYQVSDRHSESAELFQGRLNFRRSFDQRSRRPSVHTDRSTGRKMSESVVSNTASFVGLPANQTHASGHSVEVYQGIFASAASMQGWRATQEDAEVVFYFTRGTLGLPDPAPKHLSDDVKLVAAAGPAPSFAVLCVFDGHGGDAVAKFAARNIQVCITEALVAAASREAEKWSSIDQCGGNGCNGPYDTSTFREEFYRVALRDAFVRLDDRLLESPDGRDGLFGTVGATATLVLVTDRDVVCANAGDGRAILCDVRNAPKGSAGRVIPLSSDHTLYDPKEIERVKGAHCNIIGGRIEGMLAVPRALGDFDFKQAGALPPDRQAVTCVPDVVLVTRSTLTGPLPQPPPPPQDVVNAMTSPTSHTVRRASGTTQTRRASKLLPSSSPVSQNLPPCPAPPALTNSLAKQGGAVPPRHTLDHEMSQPFICSVPASPQAVDSAVVGARTGDPLSRVDFLPTPPGVSPAHPSAGVQVGSGVPRNRTHSHSHMSFASSGASGAGVGNGSVREGTSSGGMIVRERALSVHGAGSGQGSFLSSPPPLLVQPLVSEVAGVKSSLESGWVVGLSDEAAVAEPGSAGSAMNAARRLSSQSPTPTQQPRESSPRSGAAAAAVFTAAVEAKMASTGVQSTARQQQSAVSVTSTNPSQPAHTAPTGGLPKAAPSRGPTPPLPPAAPGVGSPSGESSCSSAVLAAAIAQHRCVPVSLANSSTGLVRSPPPCPSGESPHQSRPGVKPSAPTSVSPGSPPARLGSSQRLLEIPDGEARPETTVANAAETPASQPLPPNSKYIQATGRNEPLAVKIAESVRVGPSGSSLPLAAELDEDWFIIMACDGIWEVLENEDVCAHAHADIAAASAVARAPHWRRWASVQPAGAPGLRSSSPLSKPHLSHLQAYSTYCQSQLAGGASAQRMATRGPSRMPSRIPSRITSPTSAAVVSGQRAASLLKPPATASAGNSVPPPLDLAPVPALAPSGDGLRRSCSPLRSHPAAAGGRAPCPVSSGAPAGSGNSSGLGPAAPGVPAARQIGPFPLQPLGIANGDVSGDVAGGGGSPVGEVIPGPAGGYFPLGAIISYGFSDAIAGRGAPVEGSGNVTAASASPHPPGSPVGSVGGAPRRSSNCFSAPQTTELQGGAMANCLPAAAASAPLSSDAAFPHQSTSSTATAPAALLVGEHSPTHLTVQSQVPVSAPAALSSVPSPRYPPMVGSQLSAVLHGNVVNECVAAAALGLLRRAVRQPPIIKGTDGDPEDTTGMDNMSVIVARLAPAI